MSEVPLYRFIRRRFWGALASDQTSMQRKFFIDNLLVRIHLIIEMTLVDRSYAMRV